MYTEQPANSQHRHHTHVRYTLNSINVASNSLVPTAKTPAKSRSCTLLHYFSREHQVLCAFTSARSSCRRPPKAQEVQQIRGASLCPMSCKSRQSGLHCKGVVQTRPVRALLQKEATVCGAATPPRTAAHELPSAQAAKAPMPPTTATPAASTALRFSGGAIRRTVPHARRRPPPPTASQPPPPCPPRWAAAGCRSCVVGGPDGSGFPVV